MKSLINALLLSGILAFSATACEDDDEEDELQIHFITGAGFVSDDATLPAGSVVTIGIDAETDKPLDPIISFNISESVNGGANTTIYQETLNNVEYEHDHTYTLTGNAGDKHKLTFTITNKDGINKQIDLTLTVQ